MSQFKLIAIVPLLNCSTDYRKNLIPGRAYRFYNNYQVKVSDDGREVVWAERDKTDLIPENLYELGNGINLNFSAVVGKNGTGKSTIFELFSYFIYVLSTQKVMGETAMLKTELKELILEHEEAVYYRNSLLFSTLANRAKTQEEEEMYPLSAMAAALICMEKYKIPLSGNIFDDEPGFVSFIQDELNRFIKNKEEVIREQEKWHDALYKSLEVSIIYESDSQIMEAAFYDQTFHFSLFLPEKKPLKISVNDFDLESFFYSVSVNFSHHGLNANSIGGWINKLFHKNDAYTTPLVINPMRDDGNFDINHELSLSKERLHANLLYELVSGEKSALLGKYFIKEFIFIPKKGFDLLPYPYHNNARISELRGLEVLSEVLNDENLELDLPYWGFALAYLVKKISKIKQTYGFLIYKEQDGISPEEQFNTFLKKDKSHVTKKIRQVINFLKTSSEKGNHQFWKRSAERQDMSINFGSEKMAAWLALSEADVKRMTPSDLIEFGLPSFFNIDLLLDDSKGGDIPFSKLSSGEQQMILNSNGLLYHLSNINSVHQTENDEKNDEKNDEDGNEKDEDKNKDENEDISKDTDAKADVPRIAYRNVNIILDEVELYYHPEMQRNLISDLMKTFEKVRHLGAAGIQSINVCILTHSPFILSDIPKQNVLNLTDDDSMDQRSKETQTFGANIHEMLIGKFFMESTTGEYVRILSEELLDLYASISLAQFDEEMDELRKVFDRNKAKFIFLVNNIGEEVVGNILKNHLEYMEEVFDSHTNPEPENEKD